MLPSVVSCAIGRFPHQPRNPSKAGLVHIGSSDDVLEKKASNERDPGENGSVSFRQISRRISDVPGFRSCVITTGDREIIMSPVPGFVQALLYGHQGKAFAGEEEK